MISTRSLALVSFLLLLVPGCGDGGSPSGSGATAAAASGTAAATGTAAAGPKSQSPVVGFCLGADGNSQDCGIACTVTKDEASCAKWATLTKAICGKITKAQCQEICEKDKNPTACEIAKTMK